MFFASSKIFFAQFEFFIVKSEIKISKTENVPPKWPFFVFLISPSISFFKSKDI